MTAHEDQPLGAGTIAPLVPGSTAPVTGALHTAGPGTAGSGAAAAGTAAPSGAEIDFWRQRWLHEDELVNHRLTWLLVSQTILFAGYATLLNLLFGNGTSLAGANRVIVLHIVTTVFPIVGLAIATFIGLGVVAALIALLVIHRKANARHPGRFEFGIHWSTTLLGWGAGGALPLMFAAVWWYLRGLLHGLT